MQILIQIECDNEAFSERPGEEVARILGVAAKVFRHGVDYRIDEADGYKLKDINGNTVGKITVIS
jgi:hypothetical protein